MKWMGAKKPSTSLTAFAQWLPPADVAQDRPLSLCDGLGWLAGRGDPVWSPCNACDLANPGRPHRIAPTLPPGIEPCLNLTISSAKQFVGTAGEKIIAISMIF